MKTKLLLAFVLLSINSMAQATLVEEFAKCKSVSWFDSKKNECKAKVLLDEMNKSQDRSRYIYPITACKALAMKPNGYWNMVSGIVATFSDGGMGVDQDIRAKCMDAAASFIDKNPAEKFDLKTYIKLYKIMCSTAVTVKGDEGENQERRYSCFTEPHSFSNSEISHFVSGVEYNCRLKNAVATNFSAEKYLAGRSQCLEESLANYINGVGDNTREAAIHDSGRGTIKPKQDDAAGVVKATKSISK